MGPQAATKGTNAQLYRQMELSDCEIPALKTGKCSGSGVTVLFTCLITY